MIFYLGLENSGLKSFHGRRYILSHRQKYHLVKPKTMIGWEVIITHWDLVYESTYPILPTYMATSHVGQVRTDLACKYRSRCVLVVPRPIAHGIDSHSQFLHCPVQVNGSAYSIAASSRTSHNYASTKHQLFA